MRENIHLNKHKKKHNKRKNKQLTQVDTEKDIVIQRKGQLAQNTTLNVPKAMDPLNKQEAAALPAYTQKQWIADKDEVPEENMKTAPSIAEIKMPTKNNNTDFKVIYDYDDPRYYENLQLSDGSDKNVNTTIIKLDKIDTNALNKTNNSTPAIVEAKKDPTHQNEHDHKTDEMAKSFDKKVIDKSEHENHDGGKKLNKDDTIIETKNSKKKINNDHTPTVNEKSQEQEVEE